MSLARFSLLVAELVSDFPILELEVMAEHGFLGG